MHAWRTDCIINTERDCLRAFLSQSVLVKQIFGHVVLRSAHPPQAAHPVRQLFNGLHLLVQVMRLQEITNLWHKDAQILRPLLAEMTFGTFLVVLPLTISSSNYILIHGFYIKTLQARSDPFMVLWMRSHRSDPKLVLWAQTLQSGDETTERRNYVYFQPTGGILGNSCTSYYKIPRYI